MVRCSNCGNENPDNIKFCPKCGQQVIINNQDLNNNQQFNQQNPNDFNNMDDNQRPLEINRSNQEVQNQVQSTSNNLQNYNQDNTQKNYKSKNLLLAMILSFVIFGLGNVYAGLIKRGLIELAVGVVLNLLFAPLAVIWWIYTLYDTYVCVNAINNNTQIPKLLNSFDIYD